MRTGLCRWRDHGQHLPTSQEADVSDWQAVLPFASPDLVRQWAVENSVDIVSLRDQAQRAANGEILCFGRWYADFKSPIQWQLNPRNGQEWLSTVHWSQALASAPSVGDVKLTWEVARFTHAYAMARCAAVDRSLATTLGMALKSQIESFIRNNPICQGIHWFSGLEIALRGMAWTFASHVFSELKVWHHDTLQALASHLVAAAEHVERYLSFARYAAYNDHLLGEAFYLYLVGNLVKTAPRAKHWRELGRSILTAEADKQFYPDGSYLMLSHNYHRDACQIYLWAISLTRKVGDPVPAAWLQAMQRSLKFLHSHLCAPNGHLPNFGFNDGSQFTPLSTAAFADFRPTLQAVSQLVDNRPVFPAGVWDEEAIWWTGQLPVDASPAATMPIAQDASFAHTGFYVARGDDQSFMTFRCGSILDRFSQIDMLHVDLWWRGLNVVADCGSYMYNDDPRWQSHFVSTACHNTLTVDRQDQMLQWRRFKTLYRTKAKLLRWESLPQYCVIEGEHYGYRRLMNPATHRRWAMFLRDGTAIVVDTLLGDGQHHAYLHWQFEDYPFLFNPTKHEVELTTPKGPFFLQTQVASPPVTSIDPSNISCDVISGQESPPRGWISRYYGEKKPAPSFALQLGAQAPITLVTVMGGSSANTTISKDTVVMQWTDRTVELAMKDGTVASYQAVQPPSTTKF